MRKIYLFVMIAGVICSSCDDVDPKITVIDENEGKKALSVTATSVKIGEDQSGALTITYAPMATLESELKAYWGLSTLSNLRIEILGTTNDYVLLGDGISTSGGHVDWGITLNNDNDDLNLTSGGGAQSCSSKDCCSGCKFNYVSAFEGSCDCTSPTATCPEGKTPLCSHTVTFDGVLRANMVENLANAQQ